MLTATHATTAVTSLAPGRNRWSPVVAGDEAKAGRNAGRGALVGGLTGVRRPVRELHKHPARALYAIEAAVDLGRPRIGGVARVQHTPRWAGHGNPHRARGAGGIRRDGLVTGQHSDEDRRLTRADNRSPHTLAATEDQQASRRSLDTRPPRRIAQRISCRTGNARLEPAMTGALWKASAAAMPPQAVADQREGLRANMGRYRYFAFGCAAPLGIPRLRSSGATCGSCPVMLRNMTL